MDAGTLAAQLSENGLLELGMVTGDTELLTCWSTAAAWLGVGKDRKQ
jgi:hypothetical protein